MTTLLCPHCQHLHNLTGRTAFDRLWCPKCDQWIMLAFRNGVAYFIKVSPPATYPRGRGDESTISASKP